MAPNNNAKHRESAEQRDLLVHLVTQGMQIHEALSDPRIPVNYNTYRKWRQRWPKFAAEVDVARSVMHHAVKNDDLTSAQFAFKYFRRVRQPFQQAWIDRIQRIRPGNILLALWPPEYGKTTTFEDYATETICRNPQWRSTVVSESDPISKKIISRVRNRLEPNGPFPNLVKDWGPFRPGIGQGESHRMTMPWNNTHFTVVQKQVTDERDHSMLAIGWKSSTVSIRTDQLHCDDLQSTKTINETPKQIEWFRQDGLSRPGESGITSVSMTRVGDDDFPVQLLEDDELDGILEVVRFPAIYQDADGNDCALWPEKHTLDNLDRIRRKIKDPAFDRNYLMDPGRSKTKRAFGEEGWGRAVMPSRGLNVPEQWIAPAPKPVIVASSDPGISPGKACFGMWVMTEESMRLTYFNESDNFERNEELIAQYAAGFRHCAQFGVIRHLAIEANNFQKGLARDERLIALCKDFGVTVDEHLTGINKYDENIGIASMANDWQAGKIQLPYAPDDFTRDEIDEFHAQFKKWKPDIKTGLQARGNKVRYDRLMMTWFAWIWWVNNRHNLTVKEPTPIKRQGLPYAPTQMTPIIPIGARI